MTRALLVFVTTAAAAAVLGACGPSEVTVTMNEDNGSGQIGTATLTDTGEGVEVVIALSKGNATGPEAAHIHPGKCGELGPPKYPLESVVDGASTTLVVTDLDANVIRLSALRESPYAVNVHSAADGTVYVSCGNIQ